MKRRWMRVSMFAGVLLLILGLNCRVRGMEAAESVRLGHVDVVSVNVASPAVIAGEIGGDFLLSNMGPPGDTDYDAYVPAVAYNSTNNRYLVVWEGDGVTLNEYEIWGQMVNAANGSLFGSNLQISFMGPGGDPAHAAYNPDVAYNSTNNEYLVVWCGDDYADDEFEIWGQRLNANTGSKVGGMIRVSTMGTHGDPDYDAYDPAVVYNSTNNQYLVVWEGDNDDAPLVDDEFEIWSMRLDASGNRLDSEPLRLSGMGGVGDANYGAYDPDVAYNSTDNQYMVVWSGDDDAYDRVDNEFEIWGQRMDASGSTMAGDFRISTMGPNKDPDHDAILPSIAYNSTNNQYLVVWEGDDTYDNLFDVFGQRLEYNGIQVGADDFFLSDVGNGPNEGYDAHAPAVAYDQCANQYLVVWYDDELGSGEFEVWGQRVNAATGIQIGDDTRISNTGPEGDASFDAKTAAVAYGPYNSRYLVVWEGSTSIAGEYEIWGQRFAGGYEVFLPLVLRN